MVIFPGAADEAHRPRGGQARFGRAVAQCIVHVWRLRSRRGDRIRYRCPWLARSAWFRRRRLHCDIAADRFADDTRASSPRSRGFGRHCRAFFTVDAKTTMTMAQSATGAKLATGLAVKSQSQPPTIDSSMAQL